MFCYPKPFQKVQYITVLSLLLFVLEHVCRGGKCSGQQIFLRGHYDLFLLTRLSHCYTMPFKCFKMLLCMHSCNLVLSQDLLNDTNDREMPLKHNIAGGSCILVCMHVYLQTQSSVSEGNNSKSDTITEGTLPPVWAGAAGIQRPCFCRWKLFCHSEPLTAHLSLSLPPSTSHYPSFTCFNRYIRLPLSVSAPWIIPSLTDCEGKRDIDWH